MNDIVQIIQQVGFPIGMCLILCYYIYKVDNKTQEILQDVKETLECIKALLQQNGVVVEEEEEE